MLWCSAARAVSEAEDSLAAHLFGAPVPLSQRPPTNRMFTLEVDGRLGMVGGGPTRIQGGLRLSPADFLELRIQPGPALLPDTLVLRLSSSFAPGPRVGLETGLHAVDLGVRLFPGNGESRGFNPDVIPSADAVLSLTLEVPVHRRVRLQTAARNMQRVQHSLTKLEAPSGGIFTQTANQLSLQADFDVLDALGLTLGVTYAHAVPTSTWSALLQGDTSVVRPELVTPQDFSPNKPWRALKFPGVCAANRTATEYVEFADGARPGFASLVDRDSNCALSLNTAATLGLTESFDAEVFGSVRAWPEPGWALGAGARWRITP
ncbi:MAG: hypothetical protein AB2A00_42655 [Myxococcota bacterium]